MICIYFQGMNEIVGPIYYVFATDSRKEWRGNINILHLKVFLMKLSLNMSKGYRHIESIGLFDFQSMQKRIVSSASPTSCQISVIFSSKA